jgi:transposase InsO family protein
VIIDLYSRVVIGWKLAGHTRIELACQAVAESFFSTLKTEQVNHESYNSIHDARMSLFQYIEGF